MRSTRGADGAASPNRAARAVVAVVAAAAAGLGAAAIPPAYAAGNAGAAVSVPAPDAKPHKPHSGLTYHKYSIVRHGHRCANLGVYDVDTDGDVTGIAFCNGPSRAFLRGKHRHADFAAPGPKSDDTETVGLADSGALVVDRQTNFRGPRTSYLRSPHGKYSRVDDPAAGRLGTGAEDVNSHGTVVGYYAVGHGVRTKGFIRRDGHYHDFAIGRKYVSLVLLSVNDRGDVAGYYTTSNGQYHGFVDIGGTVREVKAPAAGKGRNEGTVVNAISDDRSYCGVAYFAHKHDETTSFAKGWVHRNGRFRGVNVPHKWGINTSADGLNDRGSVVGDYVRVHGNSWRRYGFTAR